MRKTLTILTTIAALCLLSWQADAQKKTNSTYNLQRAYEVLQEDRDEAQALKLLREQVKTTPDNTEAYLLIARINREMKKYGDALAALNQAIKVNRPKTSDIKTSVLHWWKGAVYEEMDDLEKAAECYATALSMARKDYKDNVQDIAFRYGQILYSLGRVDESDAVYRQMLNDDECDVSAMAGLARNMIGRGEYANAVELLTKTQRLEPDYGAVYKFRMQAYDRMGETDKAIDDAMEYLNKDEDAWVEQAAKIALKHKTYAMAKARTAMKSSENETNFRELMLDMYEMTGDYENAIMEYDAIEEEYGQDEFIYIRRADNYSSLGLTDIALSEIRKAIDICDDYANNVDMADILRRAGRYEEAVESFTRALEIDPTGVFAYYGRGWCHELMGDLDEALKDYDLGIDMDKDYAYIYLMRGEIHQKRGDMEKAREDFGKVLQIDTTARSGSCRMYALAFLGREQEADEWMDKIIGEEPDDAGVWYDRSCLYSRTGRHDEAVSALKRCLEMGYCSFEHIRHDDDMDGIRDREDFKGIIAEYEARHAERLERMPAMKALQQEKEEMIVEVPITRHAGGTFDVDCSVNGLQLSMIFDTGASDVSISKVEADFMLKNNYLSKNDIRGRQYFQTADGGISEGTVITLREVSIGDAVLHNVTASVVKSQKAPLLLGESVLRKFGTFTVDNINSKLIIKH